MSERLGIVVDASVVRGAGASSVAASACMDCLGEIQKRCVVVMSREIEWEWMHTTESSPEGMATNMSQYAALWYSSMRSQRRVRWVSSKQHCDVCRELSCLCDPSFIVKLQQDFHLVDAALESDRRVVSRDKKMRRALERACTTVTAIRHIAWVVPPDHDAASWIASGALLGPPFCLDLGTD
ncbi:MAG: hypothetical protein GX601_20250 [Anaerolineales bacterium]|nr:hypothetical protein [Anaerolineales bacterium]